MEEMIDVGLDILDPPDDGHALGIPPCWPAPAVPPRLAWGTA